MSGAPVTYSEMRQAVLAEADRIAGTQDALVAGGCRAAPDAGELRRRVVFEKIADLLDRIMTRQDVKDRLRGKP